jgi:uncharacterized protein (TIGR02246 family)
MNAIEVVRRYNTAWNGRDADALVALFAEGGTFSNPHAGQGLTGEAIGNYAKAVWAAFPDMTVELVSVREMGPGQVAHEWVCVAPTVDRSWTAPQPRVAPSPFQEVTSLRWRAIKSARSM